MRTDRQFAVALVILFFVAVGIVCAIGAAALAPLPKFPPLAKARLKVPASTNAVPYLPKPKRIALIWSNAPQAGPFMVEVWGSVNLKDWRFVCAVEGTNVILPADGPAMFFKVRTRDTAGRLSDWSKK